jgi:hypothetical protein
MSKLPALSSLAILSACSMIPVADPPDPHAPQAVSRAEPMIRECRSRFQSALGRTPATLEGPTVVNAPGVTTIRLTALPTSPDAIDPVLYVCEFSDGALVYSGPPR